MALNKEFKISKKCDSWVYKLYKVILNNRKINYI